MKSIVNTSRIATLQKSNGQLHQVTDFPFVIGRDEGVDLSLSDPSVSRQHAKIELEHGRYLLIDLKSTNGTRVNNKKITQTYLENQDEVLFGDEKFIFALMHPAHAKVMAASRLADDEQEAKRTSSALRAVEDEDLDADGEMGTEDRNWFIWAVALVILVAMLGSGYLLFQVRGGHLGKTFKTVELENAGLENAGLENAGLENAGVESGIDSEQQMNSDEVVDPDNPPLQLTPAPNGMGDPVDAMMAQSMAAQHQLNNADSSSSTNGQDNTEGQNKAETEPSVTQPDEWPALDAMKQPAEVNQPAAASNSAALSKSESPANQKVKSTLPKDEKKKSNAQPVEDKVGDAKAKINMPDPIELYAEGDAPSALKALALKIENTQNAKQKASLTSQLQSIESLYQQYKSGKAAMAKGNKNQAFQEWLSFLSNERELMTRMKRLDDNQRSRYAQEIAKNVGEEYFLLGNAAKANRNFADAYRYWMLATKYSESPRAFANANTIEQYARKMYDQAEDLESRQPQEASRLWRQVLTLLPKDHDLCIKAAVKLASQSR